MPKPAAARAGWRPCQGAQLDGFSWRFQGRAARAGRRYNGLLAAVMAGLVPAIHVFLSLKERQRRGCPGQARAWRPQGIGHDDSRKRPRHWRTAKNSP